MAMQTLRLCGLTAMSILLISACSTEVKFVPINTSKPIEGVVYHLPATVMSFTPTYQLDECGSQPRIKIAALEVKEEVGADRRPEATYILNHQLLTDWLKMIESAKIELHPTGTLKSVTYKAQDKTREVIKEAFGAAKSIALAASGLPPLPRAMKSVAGVSEYCNQATKDALTKKLALETKIEALKNKLDGELGGFASNPDAARSQTIDLIQNQLDKAIQRLAAIKSGQLQTSFSVKFFPLENQLVSQVSPKPHIFFKWFDNAVIANPSDIESLLKMNVTLKKSDLRTFQSCPTTKNEGILYRIPDYYTITIEHDGRNAEVKEIPILQLGCLARFEVKNGLWQNNVHEINFSGNGSLESFHFADNAARAQQLLGTINDAVSEAGSFESQRLSQQAELDKKKKERLDAEKERLKAERELAEERTKQE